MEKLFREAKVSSEAVDALKHFSCDACDRLKQPQARGQVAIAHAEMSNDVVSIDGNFWKLKKRNSRDKNTLTVLNIADAASGIHIASKQKSKSDVVQTLDLFLQTVEFVCLEHRNV